ncbi:Translation initiation factor IF-2 [Babesia sp. Xinjiang]|uniref:Translation initiation factor IF-2 n=1 Tax=Babesia sp. Xinjiang TaxID=462227 RepID=UPI000A21C03A|nr:Translation initiation factor IF-2 [Babesia sp. Xinjiang]ORM40459.1 Translation initiation factor IF-2 [Babesia sp. Xinjiang]
MTGFVLGDLNTPAMDLGRMIKTDGTDLFAGYIGAARERLPQLAETVVDTFGRVKDIFERPMQLRKPEFDTEVLKPSRQVDLAETHRASDIEVKPVPKQRINEDLRVEHLADITKAQFDATQSNNLGKVNKLNTERRVTGLSASPCDIEARLCSDCYLSLATVRCDSCVTHFCGVCAVQRHSDGINQTHKLVTATSGKEARLTASDALCGDLSYGQMATQPSGSIVGNMYQDLTIQIRPGESAFPSYDMCAVHSGLPLKFACVHCHLLPICDQCAKEAHVGNEHKVVEIESAVAEVKALLGECLGAVVRRHNDLSLVLPELQQVSDTANAGLKNATRSIRGGLQRVLDALKLKRTLGMQDIVNMQQVGSAALNRLMHASGALNKYLRGCVSQLEAINRIQNPGMALNMFVDLRANFEKMLFTDEEIPDLVLEVPHWQLHCGNLPNLLSDHESRLNSNFAQISALASSLRRHVRETVSDIEQVSKGTSIGRNQPVVSQQVRRYAERRTRPAGPAVWVEGAENTLDIVTHAELKGLFLRRDSQRCVWRQRAVYLCGVRLFVMESDFFAEDVPVESSIDLGAVTIRKFSDPDVLQITKLQRMGHPNGFEVTEHNSGAMRYWLFTCESDKTVQLWVARLNQVAQHLQNERDAVTPHFKERERTDTPQVGEAPPDATLQMLHRVTCEPSTTGFVADPEGEHRTCEETHDVEYMYDEQNFKLVAESLRKIKNESKSLYNKCFRGDIEAEVGRLQVERISHHAASLPLTESLSQADDASICTSSPRENVSRTERISVGRYAMPEMPLQRSLSRWLSYRGRFLPLGRAAFRKTLLRGRAQRSPEILLPPWVAVHELRLMLRVNYPACLRACGVSVARGSYSWSDVEGRRFRTDNKRHVLVPFEAAAAASKNFGFQAIRVSPEPSTPQRCVDPRAIPVIAIVGHKDHGKTTLMERLSGEVFAAYELGNTTQEVVIRSALLPTETEPLRATLMDTPGDELFEMVRGRALHLADVAVVVLSAEGGETQTRDLILQADRFRVPVVFCINKADLEFSDPEVARAELRAQCLRMHSAGLISSGMVSNVEGAVAVSARTGACISSLGTGIVRTLANVTLPVNPVVMKDCFGGVPLSEVESFIRRTNCLVSTGAPPIAICFILEVERTHSFGVVLTVVIRHGVLIEGGYFVAGTEYGRVSGIYPSYGRIAPDTKVERATVGHAVRVTGLKTVSGTSADDLLLTLPQHEAFRLSQYRRDIQLLRANQLEGPPIDLPWAVLLKSKEDVGYDQDTTTTASSLDGENTSDVADSGDDVEELGTVSTSIYLRPIDDDMVESSGDLEAELCATETDKEIPSSPSDSASREQERYEENTPHEAWVAEVAQRNAELQNRWRVNLNRVEPSAKVPKAHGVISPPKVTLEMGRPVIPVILRANFVGSFDALLDGFEDLERKYHVRIPVVHGGLGAVAPNDVVQADVGNKFGYCPIYAFQVPVLTDAAKHAVINHVTVKQFNVYSDLLADVEKRCERAVRLANEAREREFLTK